MVPTPKVFFNFDETSGNALDAVNALVGVNTSVTYGAGQINNAAYYNGSAFHAISDNALLKPVNAISFGGWIYISATSSYQMLMAKGENAGDTRSYEARCFGTTTQFEVQMRAGGGSYIQARSTTALGTGVWKHVIYTRLGTTQKIYINKVSDTLASNVTHAGNLDYSTDALWFGQRNGGLRFNGRLDAWGIWDVELTASEVAELYDGPLQYPFASPYQSAFMPLLQML